MPAQNVSDLVGNEAGILTSDEEMRVLDFSKWLPPFITPQKRHKTVPIEGQTTSVYDRAIVTLTGKIAVICRPDTLHTVTMGA